MFVKHDFWICQDGQFQWNFCKNRKSIDGRPFQASWLRELYVFESGICKTRKTKQESQVVWVVVLEAFKLHESHQKAPPKTSGDPYFWRITLSTSCGTSTFAPYDGRCARKRACGGPPEVCCTFLFLNPQGMAQCRFMGAAQGGCDTLLEAAGSLEGGWCGFLVGAS